MLETQKREFLKSWDRRKTGKSMGGKKRGNTAFLALGLIGTIIRSFGLALDG
jgi:hypothetical protein